MGAFTNISADLKAAGDAGDAVAKLTYGTPGSKVIPYPGAMAEDTGQSWGSDKMLQLILDKVGDEVDRAYAAWYMSTPAGTTCNPINTYTKMQGATAVVSGREVSMPAANRLQYTGARDRDFLVLFGGSAAYSVSTATCAVAIFKNAAQTNWARGNYHAVHTQEHPFGVFGLVTLSQNDYVELFVKANVSGTFTPIFAQALAIELS